MDNNKAVPLKETAAQIEGLKSTIEFIDKQEELKKELQNSLMIYKSKINPLDKMQASNYKWVVNFIGFTRKKRTDWKEECIDFLKLAIESQEEYLANVEKHSK